MPKRIENPYEFLTNKEVRALTAQWVRRAREIGVVGQTEERRTVEADLNTIKEVTGRISQRSAITNFDSDLDRLQGLVGGSGTRPILSKVLAMVTCVDVLLANHLEPVVNYLVESIQTDPTLNAAVILSGAADYSLRKNGRQGVFGYEETFTSISNSKSREEKMLAVKTVSTVLERMLTRDPVRNMALPVVEIQTSEVVNAAEEAGGEGRPDVMMILPHDRVPSWKKLVEAAINGVPAKEPGILEKRLPRVLVGIEVVDRRNSGKNEEVVGEELRQSRKFVHLQLRGLRSSTPANQGGGADLCTYDSLTYIGAVRAMRKGREYLANKNNSIWEKGQEESRKGIYDEAINYCLKYLTLDVPQTEAIPGDPTSRVSILKSAVKEARNAEGIDGWEMETVRGRLVNSIRDLMLKEGDTHEELRSEEEMAQKYKQHVWSEMTFNDKTLMVLGSLRFGQNPIISSYFGIERMEEIAGYLEGKIDLSQVAKDNLERLMENFGETLIDLKVETVRNKKEPTPSIIILDPDDEE